MLVAAHAQLLAGIHRDDDRGARWFLAKAHTAGFSGLEGHRSIGGLRASLYNAVSAQAVQQLAGLLDDFAQRRA